MLHLLALVDYCTGAIRRHHGSDDCPIVLAQYVFEVKFGLFHCGVAAGERLRRRSPPTVKIFFTVECGFMRFTATVTCATILVSPSEPALRQPRHFDSPSTLQEESMSHATVNRFASKTIAFHEIPIIDIAGLVDGSDVEAVARRIGQACEQVGFFYVKNHGVPSELVKRMYAATEEFFGLPDEAKNNVHIEKSGPTARGYIPPFAENADPQNNVDLKEAFDYAAKQDRVSPFFGPNLMPAELPEFEITCDEYYAAMRTLAGHLVRAFAISLGLPADYFERMQTDPITIQRLLHYPPQDPTANDNTIGIGAHTDKGILTILSQDNVGGLQVQNKDGEWISAPPVEDAFVINIGDLVQLMTNGKYSSTIHRVVNESGAGRYSVAFFIDLDFDALVETVPTCVDADHPANPAPFTCGEYKSKWFMNVYPHLKDGLESVSVNG
ncbi:isopenicillin N synthase family dioxygenase [Rhodococcus aetherivorans]